MSNEVIHYGIKGMKWGRRKDKGNSAVSNKEYSDDATKAKASQDKARSKGIQSLTNDELRSLNDRLNLEQNYSRMQPAKVNRGKQIVKGITTGVKILNDVDRAVSKIPGLPGMDDPKVKKGRQILRTAEMASDFVNRFNK